MTPAITEHCEKCRAVWDTGLFSTCPTCKRRRGNSSRQERTLYVDLPIDAALTAEAERLRVSKSELVNRALAAYLPRVATMRSLAEDAPQPVQTRPEKPRRMSQKWAAPKKREKPRLPTAEELAVGMRR